MEDLLDGSPHWIEVSPHKIAWCSRCGRRRRLKNMLVLAQAWYDPAWFCAECPPRKRRKRRPAGQTVRPFVRRARLAASSN